MNKPWAKRNAERKRKQITYKKKKIEEVSKRTPKRVDEGHVVGGESIKTYTGKNGSERKRVVKQHRAPVALQIMKKQTSKKVRQEENIICKEQEGEVESRGSYKRYGSKAWW